jgi:hypothetical protein
MTPMQKKVTLELTIQPQEQGKYLLLPFSMPVDVESLHLSYLYPRYQESEALSGKASFMKRQEINIVDLGLIAPDGTQVGASGSDKSEISVSEVTATPGYRACPLVPGEWKILVGAYKIAPEGVRVTYEVTFTYKKRRWLKGDLHTHTLASDGVLTAEELAWRAVRHGLDFLAITDHNQMISKEALPQVPGLTLIPGVEWTHYQGHANFLGVDRPYDVPFAANTQEEIASRFDSARQRGALITINHPFEEICKFQLDYNTLPFDCLEIWNGPMRESNLKAVGLWQKLLEAGRRIPICGGSDYHRDTPFIFLGGPTTCVYAMSAGLSDILAGLKAGHAYITFAPNGPWLEASAGEATLGEAVSWPEVREINLHAGGLLAGDVVRVVTGTGSEVIVEAPAAGDVRATYAMPGPGFARVEILRGFLPGIPMLPALMANPIYFTGG